jgi:hypothetical protein
LCFGHGASDPDIQPGGLLRRAFSAANTVYGTQAEILPYLMVVALADFLDGKLDEAESHCLKGTELSPYLTPTQ